MMLSRVKAEQVALMKAVQGVVFAIKLLISMKTLAKLSVMERVDNVRAILMVTNIIT